MLGSTRLGHACVVEGLDPDAERLKVRFEAGALSIYVADEFGLLSEDQVEWIALHEIGHALGMRAHSPIPADLMYEVLRDRVIVREGLSIEDGNSFVSLYTLPNGTVYADADATSGAPGEGPPPPPTGPPILALAPHVDSRLGFRVRLPHGWMRVETAQGVAAVDGVTWDYSASYQVVVSGQPTLDAYLERYGAWYAGRGRLLRGQELVVNGHRALQGVLVRSEGGLVEELTLIESGDGRVIVVTAECAAEQYETYAPWFDAVLETLEIDPLAKARAAGRPHSLATARTGRRARLKPRCASADAAAGNPCDGGIQRIRTRSWPAASTRAQALRAACRRASSPWSSRRRW